jgi:hypothetical protein
VKSRALRLVIRVNRATWDRVDQLQSQFAGLKADSIYRGVRIRNDIERLNDSLPRHRLRRDPGRKYAVYDRL